VRAAFNLRAAYGAAYNGLKEFSKYADILCEDDKGEVAFELYIQYKQFDKEENTIMFI
jgi:hypothetical protein